MSGIARKLQRQRTKHLRAENYKDNRRTALPELGYREHKRSPAKSELPPVPRHAGQLIQHLLVQRDRSRPLDAQDYHSMWPQGERGWMSHPPGAPEREDKGQRDGSCNRSACQDSLKGLPRWSMRDYGVQRRLYYCVRCAAGFSAADFQFGQDYRCSIHPGDEL